MLNVSTLSLHVVCFIALRLQLTAFLAVVWCLSLLLYLFGSLLALPKFASPLCLVVFFLAYLFNPFRVLHYRARRWLLRVLVSYLASSFLR